MAATAAVGQRGGLIGWAKTLAELAKLPISFMVTVTSATGFFLFAGALHEEIWTCTVGTLLLASASGTFNHLQDRHLDGRMERTCNRPLPAGRVDRATATFIGLIFAGLGFAALASAPANPVLLLALGAAAMVWYNGVYTYLKRVTAFAVVPGALIGALPPVIGWCAAGGSITDPFIWVVAGFFYVWQVPHFWLLALRHDADYRQAGLPVITDRFAPPQVRRVIFAWILAAAVAAMIAGRLAHMVYPVFVALAAAAGWLALTSRALLGPTADPLVLRKTFAAINIYALLVAALLSGAGLMR